MSGIILMIDIHPAIFTPFLHQIISIIDILMKKMMKILFLSDMNIEACIHLHQNGLSQGKIDE